MSEWVEKPLRQLAKFQKGRKVATSDYQQSEYDVYLGASSLGGAVEGYASTKLAVLAEPDDVLMLWDGERSGLVGHGLRGVVSSTVQRLMPGKEITGTYLYYHLLSRFDWIQGRRTGTGVPHVPKDLARILTVKYPVNPIEQERITEVLASLDKSIEKTEALIAKHQQIKAGLMHDLFTRGVTADGKLRPPREQAPELYHETPIGWIPKEWEVMSLRGCLNGNPTNGIYKPPALIGHGNLLVGQTAFTLERSIDFAFARRAVLSKDELSHYGLMENDILVTRVFATVEGVGQPTLVPAMHEPAVYESNMMRLRVERTIMGFPQIYGHTAKPE